MIYTNKLTRDYLKNNPKIITSEIDGSMWTYKNGNYHPRGHIAIRKHFLDESTRTLNEAIDKIKRRTYQPESIFDSNPNKIACTNKTINLNNMTAEKHSPNNFLKRRIPVKYNPKANCVKIDKFLNKMFKPEDVKTIYEMIGYALMRNKPFKATFIIYGEGNTGKSTLLRVLEHFFGEENCSAVGFHSLKNNDYLLANFKDKLINLGDDISDRDFNETSIIKWLTGGDNMITVRNIYKAPEEMKYKPVLVFCANKLPTVPNDDAFYRRCVLLEAQHVFKNSSQEKVVKKLTTASELSGLLNKALTGLLSLKQRGSFEKQKNVGAIRNTWMNNTKDPIANFISNHIIVDTSSIVPKSNVYKKYCSYCETNNYAPLLTANFGKQFRSKVKTMLSHQIGDDKKGNVNYYVGIKLN